MKDITNKQQNVLFVVYGNKCINNFANNINLFDSLEQTEAIQAIASFTIVLNFVAEVEDMAELVDYDNGVLTDDDLIDLEALQVFEE